MAARSFRVGDLVCGVPPNLDYWWPAQVADISHVPAELREELGLELGEYRDGVLLRYFGSPSFEYAVCEDVVVENLCDETDLGLLFVPSMGKNRKPALRAIEEVRSLLRHRLHGKDVRLQHGAKLWKPVPVDLSDERTWPADLRQRASLLPPRALSAEDCGRTSAASALGALLAAARGTKVPLQEEVVWTRLVYSRHVAKGEHLLQRRSAAACAGCAAPKPAHRQAGVPPPAAPDASAGVASPPVPKAGNAGNEPLAKRRRVGGVAATASKESEIRFAATAAAAATVAAVAGPSAARPADAVCGDGVPVAGGVSAAAAAGSGAPLSRPPPAASESPVVLAGPGMKQQQPDGHQQQQRLQHELRHQLQQPAHVDHDENDDDDTVISRIVLSRRAEVRAAGRAQGQDVAGKGPAGGRRLPPLLGAEAKQKLELLAGAQLGCPAGAHAAGGVQSGSPGVPSYLTAAAVPTAARTASLETGVGLRHEAMHASPPPPPKPPPPPATSSSPLASSLDLHEAPRAAPAAATAASPSRTPPPLEPPLVAAADGPASAPFAEHRAEGQLVLRAEAAADGGPAAEAVAVAVKATADFADATLDAGVKAEAAAGAAMDAQAAVEEAAEAAAGTTIGAALGTAAVAGTGIRSEVRILMERPADSPSVAGQRKVAGRGVLGHGPALRCDGSSVDAAAAIAAHGGGPAGGRPVVGAQSIVQRQTASVDTGDSAAAGSEGLGSGYAPKPSSSQQGRQTTINSPCGSWPPPWKSLRPMPLAAATKPPTAAVAIATAMACDPAAAESRAAASPAPAPAAAATVAVVPRADGAAPVSAVTEAPLVATPTTMSCHDREVISTLKAPGIEGIPAGVGVGGGSLALSVMEQPPAGSGRPGDASVAALEGEQRLYRGKPPARRSSSGHVRRDLAGAAATEEDAHDATIDSYPGQAAGATAGAALGSETAGSGGGAAAAAAAGLHWRFAPGQPHRISSYRGGQLLAPEDVPVGLLQQLRWLARDPLAAAAVEGRDRAAARPELFRHAAAVLLCRELCFVRSHLAQQGTLGSRTVRLLQLAGAWQQEEEEKEQQQPRQQEGDVEGDGDGAIGLARRRRKRLQPPLPPPPKLPSQRQEEQQKRQKKVKAGAERELDSGDYGDGEAARVRTFKTFTAGRLGLSSEARHRRQVGTESGSTGTTTSAGAAGDMGPDCRSGAGPSAAAEGRARAQARPSSSGSGQAAKPAAPKLGAAQVQVNTRLTALEDDDEIDLAAMEVPLQRIVDVSARCVGTSAGGGTVGAGAASVSRALPGGNYGGGTVGAGAASVSRALPGGNYGGGTVGAGAASVSRALPGGNYGGGTAAVPRRSGALPNTVCELRLSSLVDLKSATTARKPPAHGGSSSAPTAGAVLLSQAARPTATTATAAAMAGQAPTGARRPSPPPPPPARQASSASAARPPAAQPPAQQQLNAVQGQAGRTGSIADGGGGGGGSNGGMQLLIWFGKGIPMPTETIMADVAERSIEDPVRRPTVKMDYSPGMRCVSLAFPLADDAQRLAAQLRFNGCNLLKVSSMQNIKVEMKTSDVPAQPPWPQPQKAAEGPLLQTQLPPPSQPPSAAATAAPQLPSRTPWPQPDGPGRAKLQTVLGDERGKEGGPVLSAKLPPRPAAPPMRPNHDQSSEHARRRQTAPPAPPPSAPPQMPSDAAAIARPETSAPLFSSRTEGAGAVPGAGATAQGPWSAVPTPVYVPLYSAPGGMYSEDEQVAPWLAGGLYSPSRAQQQEEENMQPPSQQQQQQQLHSLSRAQRQDEELEPEDQRQPLSRQPQPLPRSLSQLPKPYQHNHQPKTDFQPAAMASAGAGPDFSRADAVRAADLPAAPWSAGVAAGLRLPPYLEHKGPGLQPKAAAHQMDGGGQRAGAKTSEAPSAAAQVPHHHHEHHHPQQQQKQQMGGGRVGGYDQGRQHEQAQQSSGGGGAVGAQGGDGTAASTSGGQLRKGLEGGRYRDRELERERGREREREREGGDNRALTWRRSRSRSRSRSREQGPSRGGRGASVRDRALLADAPRRNERGGSSGGASVGSEAARRAGDGGGRDDDAVASKDRQDGGSGSGSRPRRSRSPAGSGWGRCGEGPESSSARLGAPRRLDGRDAPSSREGHGHGDRAHKPPLAAPGDDASATATGALTAAAAALPGLTLRVGEPQELWDRRDETPERARAKGRRDVDMERCRDEDQGGRDKDGCGDDQQGGSRSRRDPERDENHEDFDHFDYHDMGRHRGLQPAIDDRRPGRPCGRHRPVDTDHQHDPDEPQPHCQSSSLPPWAFRRAPPPPRRDSGQMAWAHSKSPSVSLGQDSPESFSAGRPSSGAGAASAAAGTSSRGEQHRSYSSSDQGDSGSVADEAAAAGGTCHPRRSVSTSSRDQHNGGPTSVTTTTTTATAAAATVAQVQGQDGGDGVPQEVPLAVAAAGMPSTVRGAWSAGDGASTAAAAAVAVNGATCQPPLPSMAPGSHPGAASSGVDSDMDATLAAHTSSPLQQLPPQPPPAEQLNEHQQPPLPPQQQPLEARQQQGRSQLGMEAWQVAVLPAATAAAAEQSLHAAAAATAKDQLPGGGAAAAAAATAAHAAAASKPAAANVNTGPEADAGLRAEVEAVGGQELLASSLDELLSRLAPSQVQVLSSLLFSSHQDLDFLPFMDD